MEKERIKQVFELLEDYCENQNGCRWCPFSDDKSECRFKIATGTIPLLFINDFMDESEINWTNNSDFREGAQKMIAELKKEMVGCIYRHFKGHRYVVKDIGIHSETAEAHVVYTDFDNPGDVWVRPLKMFNSPVDREKYPEVTQNMRFEKLHEE